MLVSVAEAKMYLRLDDNVEDALIRTLLETSESLCRDIVRADLEELDEEEELIKTAVCYGVSYLYENREKADFKDLTTTLRFLLFGVRREEF